MTTELTTQVEGLVPQIHSLSLQALQLEAEIARKEAEFKEIPVVKKINQEILDLKQSLQNARLQEEQLRETAKEKLLMSGIKEIKSLDGTTVVLHSTPGALVIEEGAVIPDEYYKVKKEVDKAALKKAFNEGKQLDSKIYIQKDYKLVIK